MFIYHAVDTVSRPSASLHCPDTFSMAWFCLSVVFCGLSVLCKEQGITVVVSIEGERQRESQREGADNEKDRKKSQRKWPRIFSELHKSIKLLQKLGACDSILSIFDTNPQNYQIKYLHKIKDLQFTLKLSFLFIVYFSVTLRDNIFPKTCVFVYRESVVPMTSSSSVRSM